MARTFHSFCFSSVYLKYYKCLVQRSVLKRLPLELLNHQILSFNGRQQLWSRSDATACLNQFHFKLFKTSSKYFKSFLIQTQRCLKTFWKLKIEKLFILNSFWMKNFPSAASSADLFIIHWLWLRRWFDQLESFIKWKQSLSNDATISSNITNQPLFAHLRFVCLGPVYFLLNDAFFGNLIR